MIHTGFAGLRCIKDDGGGETVVFQDGSEQQYDVILFATGYKQKFPFLFPQGHGRDCGTDVDDPLPNEHNICSTHEPTLSFLGFVRPNVGAIPPMSEMQVFWWIQRLKGNITGPGAPPTYHLVGNHCPRTSAYSCDYGLYMHDLARDIGAIPCVFKWLAKSWRVGLGYALGQAYIGYFRLDGPYATKQASRAPARPP